MVVLKLKHPSVSLGEPIESQGGMNWKLRIDIYTLPCVE